MIHLFFNALAASAGGGLTYVRNVAAAIAADPDIECTFAVARPFAKLLVPSRNLHVIECEPCGSTVSRFFFEQKQIPALVRRSGADVLISAGNFALRHSPVPQILLARNSLYTSRDFYRDLLDRREYAIWLDTRFKALLAKRSMACADCTVAPSQAFAEDLSSWTAKPLTTIYHGFDPETFFATGGPNSRINAAVMRDAGELRLLFVSHYNYYRNFETLIRSLALLRQSTPVKLFLTCSLEPGANCGAYDPRQVRELIQRLRTQDCVVELGNVEYADLHHLYRSCDLYVAPSYAESFAHPLVEAMACGIPIVASDIPVHREICGDAAVYFPRFSAEDCASRIFEIFNSPGQMTTLREEGHRRAGDFSWERHVRELVELASNLLKRPALKKMAIGA